MKLPAAKYAVRDDNHKYTIEMPDGRTIGPLNSVSTAISVLNKPALIGWAAREAAAYFKGEILRLGAKAMNFATLEEIAKKAAQAHRHKAEKAADLGTLAHEAFMNIIQGREPETIAKELVGPIQEFKRWRLQSDIEIVAVELAVGSVEHEFGGRIDAVGYSKSRGGFGIVDYKTSSGFYGNEYAYQTGGYAEALSEMFGITVDWAEIARFSKKPPFDAEVRPVLHFKTARFAFNDLLALSRLNSQKLIGDQTFVSQGHQEKKKPNVKKSVTSPF